MSTTFPIVSVIMPVYNAGGFLRAAIESILHQTFTDFELIIINDGSTDESEQVAQSFAERDHRIRLVTQQNQGLTTTLNTLLLLSRGQYIARMDQDDVSSPDRLEKQVAFLNNHTDVGLVGSWVEVISPTNIHLTVHRYPVSDSGIKQMMLLQNPFAHGAVMMRPNPAIIYRKEFDYAEDFDRWVQLAATTKFINLPFILYHWRASEQGMSSKYSTKQRQATDQILKRTRNSFPNKSFFSSNEKYEMLAEIYYRGKLKSLLSTLRVATILCTSGSISWAFQIIRNFVVSLLLSNSKETKIQANTMFTSS